MMNSHCLSLLVILLFILGIWVITGDSNDDKRY